MKAVILAGGLGAAAIVGLNERQTKDEALAVH